MLITSKSEYNEDFAGNIIDAYGKCIDDRFPNYSSAMPSDLGLYKPYPISADDIRAGMRQLKAAVKSQGISKPDFIVRHDATDSYYSPVMLIKFADYCDGEILIHDSCRAAIHYGEDFRVLIVPKSPMTKHLFTTTINGWTFSVC